MARLQTCTYCGIETEYRVVSASQPFIRTVCSSQFKAISRCHRFTGKRRSVQKCRIPVKNTRTWCQRAFIGLGRANARRAGGRGGSWFIYHSLRLLFTETYFNSVSVIVCTDGATPVDDIIRCSVVNQKSFPLWFKTNNSGFCLFLTVFLLNTPEKTLQNYVMCEEVIFCDIINQFT